MATKQMYIFFDLGESYVRWTMGDDLEILQYI